MIVGYILYTLLLYILLLFTNVKTELLSLLAALLVAVMIFEAFTRGYNG